MDPLKRVHSGDKLKIYAATHNAFVDAARAHRDQQQNTLGGNLADAPPGTVLVKNNTGADRERFDILGISGPVVTPSDNLSEFQNRLAMVGVAPSASHYGKFVILAEPLKSGKIGRAWAMGVCPVKLFVSDASDLYADVTAGQYYLTSGIEGNASVLWADTGTNPVWAIVRFGGGISLYKCEQS